MENNKISVQYNNNKVSTLQDFAKIRGVFLNGQKDVLFVRFQGINNSLQNEFYEMTKVLEEETGQALGYVRVDSLPTITSQQDIQFYSAIYEENINNCSGRLPVKIYSGNILYQEALYQAFQKVLTTFRNEKKNSNPSTEKNFGVKLMFWIDYILKKMSPDFSLVKSIKIIAENVQKKQEYFFYELLTYLGMDVCLLQTQYDVELAEEFLTSSRKISIGNYGKIGLKAYLKPMSSSATINAGQTERQPIKVQLPQRPGSSKVTTNQCSNVRNNSTPASRVVLPARTVMTTNEPRREKSFEELALLAESVVMIGIFDQNGQCVGSGSGVMIGEDGYIITNNHVVAAGYGFEVRIENDAQCYRTNEVIKYHPLFDLAIIRINRRLKPIPVYDGTTKLVRGQKVVVIGSPHGLFNTVSDGIISGFRRDEDGVELIQYTAPTSPGSSGGAVLNMYGELIGIHCLKVDNIQGLNMGISHESVIPFISSFRR